MLSAERRPREALRGSLERVALRSLLVLALLGGCVPEGAKTTEEAEAPDELAVLAPVADVLREPFRDDFERRELGPDYYVRSPAWVITRGWLCVEGAENQGVWLKKRLPPNVRIEFDAVAHSSDGDIKVELFGDGVSGASGTTYDDATSYVAVFGGWKNTTHALARLDEHDPKRQEIAVDERADDPRARAVSVGQTYRMKFERRNGNTLSWWVNGTLYFDLVDEEPLSGEGHDHFGFNDWAAHVCFDNLAITPI